jgi:hypothetical protein
MKTGEADAGRRKTGRSGRAKAGENKRSQPEAGESWRKWAKSDEDG